jgi:peptidyl-prolyl cis-trans isomerase C
MPAVVVVEGVEIPERLIAEEAQHHPGLSADEARLAAGRALATKALLLARARAMGLTPEPEFDSDGRQETDEEALVRAVLAAAVEAPTPTEAECRRIYDSRLAAHGDAPRYEAVRERIAEGLERRAWAGAAARFVAGLAAEARAGGVAVSLSDDGSVQPGSATLGGLLTEDAQTRLIPWLAAADAALADKVGLAARAEGLAADEFVRAVFGAFVETANDEAWTRAISAAQGAGDPALACLAAVLKARLEPRPVLHAVVRRR